MSSTYVGHSGRVYAGASLCGAPDRLPRRALINFLEWWPVEALTLLIILANCVTLAMDAPVGVDAATAQTLATLNCYFLYTYTAETCLKMLALGLHCGAGSFWCDGWAMFEFMVVAVSWAPVLFPEFMAHHAAIASTVRAFRALRVLLALTHIPGMKTLIAAALACIPALSAVLSLFALLIAFSSISGVQFFKGSMHYRCADTQELCGATRLCEDGGACVRLASLHTNTLMSFDSLGESLVPLLACYLLDGWSDAMVNEMAATSPYAVIYFVFLTTAGGFLMVQLFLAVVSDAFVSLENQRKEEEAIAAAVTWVQATSAEEEQALLSPPSALSAAHPSSSYCGCCAPLTRLVSSDAFSAAAVSLVVLNILVMCMPYHREPAAYTQLQEVLSTILTWAFVVEMALKLCGLGCRRYWGDGWNALDGCLVLLSLAELGLTTAQEYLEKSGLAAEVGELQVSSTLRMLRILRLLRALRMMKAWKGLYRIVLAFFASLPQIANLVLLTLAIMFLFSIVGMAIYGATGLAESSREHFDAFPVAMLSVLNLFNGNIIDPLLTSIETVGKPISVLYFGAAILIGFLGLMNLFIAILLDAFTEDEDEDDAPESSDERHLSAAEEPSSPGDSSPDSQLDAATKTRLRRVPFERLPVCCGQDTMLRRSAQWLAHSEGLEYIIICLILASSVCLVLDAPQLDPYSDLKMYLEEANLIFTIVFTLEALLKAYALGYKEYLASAWNLVDVFIVTTSLLALLATLFPALGGLQMLRILRVLRPLRLLVRNPGMKVVVDALIEALPAVVNIGGIVLGLQTVFAVIGLRLFMGTFASCTDPTYTTRTACEAAAAAAADASPEASQWHRVLKGGSSGRGRVSATIEWSNPPAGSFDDFGSAMLALFTMATGDNMPDLMYAGMDARGVDEAPVRTDFSPAALFFIAWMLVGTFIGLNLFIGAIVDTFSAIRSQSDGTVLMTTAQKQWTLLLRQSRSLGAQKVPRPPTWLASCRYPVYTTVVSSGFFEDFTLLLVVLNMALLACDHDGIEADEAFYAPYLALSNGFMIWYFVEFGIKFFALGPHGYFLGASRQFEFVLLLATLVELAETSLHISPMMLRSLSVLRLMRLLRLAQGSRGASVRELLKTLALSAPALANVASVLTLVVFIYAVLGVQSFCFIMEGEALAGPLSFSTFGHACLLLFQVLTGDGWSMLMLDAMADESQGCTRHPEDGAPSDCGSPLALPYFLSFVIIGTLVFLNLVVAVVLETFSSLSERQAEHERRLAEMGYGLANDDSVDEFISLWSECMRNTTAPLPLSAP